jgi:two-component system, NarL family, response regulator NreC
MSRITFVVAEPLFLVRKGLVNVISELPNANVVRECDSCAHIADLVLHHSANVLVINLNLLSDLSSTDIKKLTSRKRKLYIIGLEQVGENHFFGCKGILTHSIVLDESKVSIQKKFKEVLSLVNNELEYPTENSELSERESVILKDVALGLSNKEIAEKNFISPHTVITHRKNITRKLGIKTVSGLTIYAIINKLIGMDEVN